MHRNLLAVLLLAIGCTTLSAQALHTTPLRKPSQVKEYRALARKLVSTRMTVNWKEVDLAQVIKDLKRRLRLNILVARPLKARAAEEAVELSLSNVKATTVFKLLMQQHRFVFQNRDGVIFATTKEDAEKRSMVLAIHDVRAMLHVPRDFPAPKLGLRIGSPSEDEGEEEVEREAKDPELLVDLVRQATGESTWEAEGATLRISNGTLIVRHTPVVQLKVRRFLARIRGSF